ncbi:hypothetical protein A7R75_24220 [Mycolicibacterium llatzerense]|nr:hypothetical protein [Mycolicibacterium llatzerense]
MTSTPPAGGSAPWDTPVVELPDRITAKWCAQTLTTPAGNAIVRSHLEPRRQDRGYRVTWERLWRMISFDPRWRRTTIELLAEDRHHAQQALDAGLTGKAATKVRTYLHAIDRTLERLDREAAGPLAWASASYADMTPKAREVIEALALTIGDYLDGNGSRDDLAAVLAGLDLDPVDREVPPAARQRAQSARAGKARH